MLKKTMTTVDFGGTERTEDYYFNLTRAEIMEMELTTEGGLVQMINRITAAQSQLELAKLFKQIICQELRCAEPGRPEVHQERCGAGGLYVHSGLQRPVLQAGLQRRGRSRIL